MKTWIILAIGFSFASTSFAQQDDERGSREKRGNVSCTDYCTVAGKDQIKDDELIAGGYNNTDMYLAFCAAGRPADDPKNYRWCEKHCQGTGGFVSWWHGRKEQVSQFIKGRKETCEILGYSQGVDRCVFWCSKGTMYGAKVDDARVLDLKQAKSKEGKRSGQALYNRWCSEQGKALPGNYQWCKATCEHPLVSPEEVKSLIDSLQRKCEPIKQKI